MLGLLPDADTVCVDGGDTGDEDAQLLHAACRALLYECSSCSEALPVSAFSHDSLVLDLCAACLDEAEAEIAAADR